MVENTPQDSCLYIRISGYLRVSLNSQMLCIKFLFIYLENVLIVTYALFSLLGSDFEFVNIWFLHIHWTHQLTCMQDKDAEKRRHMERKILVRHLCLFPVVFFLFGNDFPLVSFLSESYWNLVALSGSTFWECKYYVSFPCYIYWIWSNQFVEQQRMKTVARVGYFLIKNIV